MLKMCKMHMYSVNKELQTSCLIHWLFQLPRLRTMNMGFGVSYGIIHPFVNSTHS